MKNLFIGLLMFAGTCVAFASNGEVKTKQLNPTETSSVSQTKVVNALEDDFCSITITTTRRSWDGSVWQITISSSTGTGTSCLAAEADARASF